MTSGTNSAVEFDVLNNPVIVPGFNAAAGWDATTGLGAPMTDGLVDDLIRFTSFDDGRAEIEGSAPHPSQGSQLSARQKRPH